MSKLKNKRASKVTAILLALMMAVVFMPTFAFAADGGAADDTIVYMTVSDQSVLATAKDGSAVAWKEVTVKDLDGDGTLTLHEALVALHTAYYVDGEAGYAAAYDEGYKSYAVSKLWGVENGGGYGFVKNGAMTAAVDQEKVAEGDYITAYVYKDPIGWSDVYTQFGPYSTATTVGEPVEIVMTDITFDASWQPVTAPVEGATLGVWQDGTVTPLGVKTDAKGAAEVSFETPGTYIVTAVSPTDIDGTSKAISAPACIVNVGAPDAIVNMTVSNEGVLAASKDGEAVAWLAVTAKDQDFDGKVTLHEALVALHETYYEGGAAGYAAAYDEGYKSYAVSKLWGVENGGGYGFVKNGALTAAVDQEVVTEGDFITAYVYKDPIGWSDVYTQFGPYVAAAYVNEPVKIDMTDITFDTDWKPVTGPVEGATLAIWNNGTVEPLDVKTDVTGAAEVTFDKPGVYVVTAVSPTDISGASTPISAPACVVMVVKQDNPMKVTAKTVKAKYNKKTVIKASKAFKIKNKKGKITYKQKTKNNKITVAKNGKITVKKGLKKGKTYKIKVNVTDSGNKEFAPVTKPVTVKIKITK